MHCLCVPFKHKIKRKRDALSMVNWFILYCKENIYLSLCSRERGHTWINTFFPLPPFPYTDDIWFTFPHHPLIPRVCQPYHLCPYPLKLSNKLAHLQHAYNTILSTSLLVYWSTGLLVYYSTCLLVYWSTGLLVY